jgi:NAD(P)H-dependent nitrite reductase large subunit/NAD(P)H-dependent nitrite reductase small subunit
MGMPSVVLNTPEKTETETKPERKKIVVIGNGMVGHRFCESLAEQDTARVHDVVVFGEEPRPAYDRVHLSGYFSGQTAEDLAVTSRSWYAERGFELCVGDAVVELDREAGVVISESGRHERYDALVLATGSAPFVPPIPGIDKPGVFVYRTIEDLEAISAWASRPGSSRAVVIGGGLLGLEAAKATVDLGLETHVVEHGDRLMPRQVDETGGALLTRAIESIGVHVHTSMRTQEVYGSDCVGGLLFEGAVRLDTDMIVVSAGIRARDDLGREFGLTVGERGGIVVDDTLATSDPHVFAIGECAQHAGTIYGLVGPGYEMAETLARRMTGGEAEFKGADLSTKLKLLGVDVASFGDAFGDLEGIAARKVVIEDSVAGVYQKLVISSDGERLLGGILVGDASPYMSLMRACRDRSSLPPRPHQLLTGVPDANSDASQISDDAQICSCNNVTKGRILTAIRERELSSPAEVKICTKAGTGCGGCLPLVKGILDQELARAGRSVDRGLCEHFPYSRQELFEIIKLTRIESFEEVLASHGSGAGCEICRPAIASILASTWNDAILNHQSIQDTNDRFLANIQRGGTYSVIPRVPGGEITPEKLIVLGEVAKKHDLYCKITGGQRVDLLGARVEELPAIWRELIDAGFESGHAYGKALRTVKSCVGKSWCRFGVQDSTGFAIRLEERYRGIRAPHKLKSAVSGCVRECAEAQSKDFGLIATEAGWNLYVCGNGGANPRHADLLATDLDEEQATRLIDRFLIYYIQTANPLERTAPWLERLEGGLERLRQIIVDDSLGFAASLEKDMAVLVASYRCEWREVVENPERQRHFRHFSNSEASDSAIEFVEERGQRQPAEWDSADGSMRQSNRETTPEDQWDWHPVGVTSSISRDSGRAIDVPGRQIAIFHFALEDRYYATENRCPHQKDMVLARGLLGTEGSEPKVACPLHKKTFSLETGKGLSDPEFCVQTFPVEVRGDELFVKLPPVSKPIASDAEARS